MKLNKKIIIAKNIFSKTRGLYFRNKNTVLLLKNCNDIHTLFFNKPISVAFLDEHFNVVYSLEKMTPFKRIKIKNAKHVLESFYNKDCVWYKKGKNVKKLFTNINN